MATSGNAKDFRPDDIATLKQFNITVDELTNYAFVKESLDRKIGRDFMWELNKDTNELEFRYNKSNHNEEFLRSFVLTLRLFIQDNEPLSIRNMSQLYGRLPIADEYKILFDKLRDNFNKFLDEPAITLSSNKPSRRIIFDAIIYGKYAHRDPKEIAKMKTWQSDDLDWDMRFYEFQQILHDFLGIVKLIEKLNERVLADYSIS
ncbi:MAG TPA: hypothetical protein VKA95_13045 [Nitrososphaeraceae archaeon]|nr:hypothetical protein [Nitrososphaeraceae archaeon]